MPKKPTQEGQNAPQTKAVVKTNPSTALAPSAPNQATLQAETLIAQAIEKGVPVETMERLLAMRRELKAEYAKESFDRAMSAFQSDCPTIEKKKKVMNKDGKTVRYVYAPIDDIIEQVRPLLKTHGFSFSIDAPVEEGVVTSICTITHAEGHSKTSTFKIPIDKDAYMSTAQMYASALTFAKRYSFCNAFGILTGDQDDDTKTMADDQKVKSMYDSAWEMIQHANLEQLKDYRGKLASSKKYTDKQKKDLLDLVDKRVAEIQKPITDADIPVIN